MPASSKSNLQIEERIRVMIADDAQQTRQSIRMLLAYIPDVEIVAIARNGIQAIEMSKNLNPDVAIMDIHMPRLDGLSSMWAMRQDNPNLVFLVVSADKDSQTLKDALSVGACAYLVKPFSAEQLENAMEYASKLVLANRQKRAKSSAPHEKLRSLDQETLISKAFEYAKERRIDNEAVELFEYLASEPDCEKRWLVHLAMLYVLRQNWGKLKLLSEKLDRQKD